MLVLFVVSNHKSFRSFTDNTCHIIHVHVIPTHVLFSLHKIRNKLKSPVAKPGRRITLTLLPYQPPSLSPHFPSPSSTNSSGNITSSSKSNPAFTNHSTAFESAPPSLSEERRLLKEERSRRRQKHGSRTAPPSQRDAGIRKPSPSVAAPRNVTARDKRSMSAQRGQQVKVRVQMGTMAARSLEANGIDFRISSHSIFELNCEMKLPERQDSSKAVSSRMDSAMSGHRSISTLSVANANWPPLPSKGVVKF